MFEKSIGSLRKTGRFGPYNEWEPTEDPQTQGWGNDSIASRPLPSLRYEFRRSLSDPIHYSHASPSLGLLERVTILFRAFLLASNPPIVSLDPANALRRTHTAVCRGGIVAAGTPTVHGNNTYCTATKLFDHSARIDPRTLRNQS